ncbi:MAG TPA: hypothetical protein VII38_13950 [Polyangia bacterium]
MAVIVKDHEVLHQAVARAALACGAAGLVGLFVPGPWAALTTALAVGVAVAIPASWGSAAWALLWACGAGAAARLGGVVGAVGGALAIGGTLGRGLGQGEESVSAGRRLLAAGVGALGAAAAALVARAFDRTDALGFLPAGPAALLAGAITGAVIGVASIGRHLGRAEPPLEGELRALAGEGELGELLGRAARAYRGVVEALGQGAPQARAAADDLVLRMARFGRLWREVETEAARTVPDDLHDRMRLLDARALASDDPLARSELGRARQALSAQLDYLAEIRRGRERAVARLSHQVATLERLRLAALRHRSVDASRLGAELQPVVDELADAGGDLDLASEALDEAQPLALPAAQLAK